VDGEVPEVAAQAREDSGVEDAAVALEEAVEVALLLMVEVVVEENQFTTVPGWLSKKRSV